MDQIIDWYKEKFDENTLFLVLRSLAYFDKADEEPDPHTIMPAQWSEIKIEIRNVVRGLV